jgi:hypothetical protein
MPSELGPFGPTIPSQPGAEYLVTKVSGTLPTIDGGEVYVRITASGTDEFIPDCLIIGEGEAELRWTTSDDFLRWLGSDADLRWEARLRLGTGEC